MNSSDPERKSESGISALVLAAGSSQRMGSPKQLLRLGGRTLLEHALSNVLQANVNEIILVLGFAAEEIRQKVPTVGLKIILNPAYQQGMGSSLRTALGAIHAQAEGVIVVLADQPFVSTGTLNRLIEYHHRHRPQIVIPTYRGFRGNPVLLDRSVFPELMNLQRDVGCRAIFGSHSDGIYKLPVDDPGILLDADTVHDFHKLETMLKVGASPAILSSLLPAGVEERADLNLSERKLQPQLVIVGNDAVAAALLRLARFLHFSTILVGPFLTLEEFPEADRILHCLDFSTLPESDDRYFVVASRGQFDEEALERAFATNPCYVALMAGRSRRDELIGILKKKGLPENRLDRLNAPAGLGIGAETPEEIALSIMAEIVAERNKQSHR